MRYPFQPGIPSWKRFEGWVSRWLCLGKRTGGGLSTSRRRQLTIEALEDRLCPSHVTLHLDGQINETPANLTLTAIPTVINENGVAKLIGAFTDAGILENHTVTIDWGDASNTLLNLVAGNVHFSARHRYLQNQAGNAPFPITVTVADKDGNSTSGSVALEVDNVAPSRLAARIVPAVIREGGTVKLTGSFFDRGSLDGHTVQIDWGDQQSSSVQLVAGTFTFGASHQYLDNKPAHEPYIVSVTVSDADGGSTAVRRRVSVVNSAPTPTIVQFANDVEGSDITLNSTVSDLGPLDMAAGFQYSWTVNRNGKFFVAGSDSSLSMLADDRGIYRAILKVTDKEGASRTAVKTLIVGNVVPTLPFRVAWGVKEPYRDVMVADLDRDGKQEVVGRVGRTGNWWAGRFVGDQFVQQEIAHWDALTTFLNVSLLDLNGDEVPDLIGRNEMTGEWLRTYFDGSSYTTESLGTWDVKPRYLLIRTGDFNGDGLVDIAGYLGEARAWQGLISGANGYTSAALATWDSQENYVHIRSLDLEGDGRWEIVGYALRSHAWIALKYDEARAQFHTTILAHDAEQSALVAVYAVDLEGDGRGDLIAFDDPTSTWRALSFDGTSYVTRTLAAWTNGLAHPHGRVADINQDGLPDLVGLDGAVWKYLWFDGSNYRSDVLSNFNRRGYKYLLIADPNGDQNDDLVAQDTTGSWWIINQRRFIGNWRVPMTFVQMGDINGDGKADVFGVSAATGNWWALLSGANDGFHHQRLTNWNRDWFYERGYYLSSDSELMDLIYREIPGLSWLVRNDRLQAARLLNDWAANHANGNGPSYSIDPTSSAAAMYNVFVGGDASVLCGGMAQFGAAVLRLFGFQAFWVDFGEAGRFTHVVAMIRMDGSYFIVDPTFNVMYVWRDRYASLPLLLSLAAQHRLDEVTIVSSPLDMRNWLVRYELPAPNDYRGKSASGRSIYGNANYTIQEFFPVLHANGLKGSGLDIIFGMVANRIFNVGPDTEAAAAFRSYAASVGIPVG